MTKHIPVLKNELIEGLALKKGDVVIDCTLGGGGHAIEVIKELEEKGGGIFVGIDFSKEAIESFNKISKEFKKVKIKLVNKNFAKLDVILEELGIDKIDKVYADLGFSSDQIEEITFRKDQELDMRMDSEMVVKAKDLLNGLYKKEIEKMFKDYGDVRYAGLLAREIEFYKQTKPFERTTQLNAVVKTVLNNVKKATIVDKELQKIYQALRVAVNSEFKNLENMLEIALEKLNILGRVAVISFHSGEDRIVKKIMKTAVKSDKFEWISELVLPSSIEVSRNSRSRSSKMRILGKLK